MKLSDAQLRRRAQAMKWFAPARFGLFYHWGLCTGGGCTHSDESWNKPLKYPTVEALERAVPDSKLVAENMAAFALRAGAKYITLTALHSCDGYCVIYPTKLKGFVLKTKLDYFGDFVRAAHAKALKPLAYIPCGPEHWNSKGGPWLKEPARDNASYSKLMEGLVRELAEQHGSKLAGFWIDGMTPELRYLPGVIHEVLPDAVVINNNSTFLEIADVDYGTTEFLAGTPDPDYCRPSALRKIEPRFSITPPGSDFNEDIPTCNGWFYREGNPGESAKPYLADPNYLVRQMISSLGQRGQWNFALGVGPRVDGTLPPEFEPTFQRLAEFMQWGSEAIYGTRGGEASALAPGFFAAPWAPGGFCSVSVSLERPGVHYVLVTSAPSVNRAGFHSGGRVPERITDLRTGAELPFSMMAGPIIENVDWSDVERYGAKVFKVEFK